jgi:hypothetical protein
MQRPSIIADIFGYIVCLIAVVIFFASVAGVVNNAFRVAHPTARGAIGARFTHRQFGRNVGMQALPGAQPGAMAAPQGFDRNAMRARFIAGARYDALRRLVVAIVMLVVSIAVFRRTFAWINLRQAVT